MAVSLSVKTDIERLTKELDNLAKKQIPYVTAVALTRTATSIQYSAGSQLNKDLDRPKAFTTNPSAFYIKMAKKNNLEAEVGFKDIQANYMQWQIVGGSRTQKPYESVLRGMGILPSGYVTVPGKGVKLNGYGNISRADIQNILSGLANGSVKTKGKGMRARNERIFAVKPNGDPRTKHLKPGIYKSSRRQHRSTRASVVNESLTPLILFVPNAQYRPAFDFRKLAGKMIEETFAKEFEHELSKALRPVSDFPPIT